MRRTLFVAAVLFSSFLGGALAQIISGGGPLININAIADAFRARHNLNVIDDGSADNTGATDASVAIQGVINSAAVSNSAVYIPCGTYLINFATLSIPDNTKIFGAGKCAILKTGSSLANNAAWGAVYPAHPLRAVLTNSNYTSGNSNITIEDVAIDISVAAVNTFAVFIYKGTGVRVARVSVTGNASGGALSEDGVAFLASNDGEVRDSRVVNIANACYDQWEGSSDISVINNYCDASNNGVAFGVLVSGFKTDFSPATTSRAKVIGNTIKNTPSVGVWVQGGWNAISGGGALYGQVTDSVVIGNNIDNVTTFHGVRVSDAARIVIGSNTIRNVNRSAVILQSENAGNQSDISVTGNIISGCNQAVAASACMLFGTTTTNSLFVANRISGAAQNYDVQINTGSSVNLIEANLMDAGGTGRILDNGTSDQIHDP